MRGRIRLGDVNGESWPDPPKEIPASAPKIVLYDAQDRPLTRAIGFRPALRKEKDASLDEQ